MDYGINLCIKGMVSACGAIVRGEKESSCKHFEEATRATRCMYRLEDGDFCTCLKAQTEN